ncbi:glycosyltransferase family 2 protein [Streptomyces sp. NPDC050264]|uniref:glycosyltransferase family 2 protein n=1 Tax=Streptomyces sp. NPDC050264 TaxID=3155038 RepID=UPI00343AA1D5
MTARPRLSIGLPVYNGEEYLAESLDALLGQTYEDFELVISDNASTDGTEEICRKYAARDSRVRYIRLLRNVGATPNHNYVFTQCRGELFKWASHDDLYARDLLRACVQALDERPEVILAHSGQAVIDGAGRLKIPYEYGLATDSPHPPERFRSLLVEPGGDDFYGVIRADVLRRVKPLDSYHHADRTFVAELTLHGPFHQVPELLYFRRDHPTRAERANPSKRARCVNLDPRRSGPLHPTPRLLAEYLGGFVSAIRRAPLSAADRRACHRHLLAWMTSRVRPGAGERIEDRAPVGPAGLTVSVDALVAGREDRASRAGRAGREGGPA